jgi:hypothetical protein
LWLSEMFLGDDMSGLGSRHVAQRNCGRPLST